MLFSPSIQVLIPAAFGLVIGSFLNVVIHRLPLNQSIVKPRSRCPHCHAPIRWQDNIPVLSFILLRAQCRHCKKKISIRYPLIEVLTALLFCAAFSKWGLGLHSIIRDWPFLAACVAITFIDLDHRIIPDELSIGGTVVGLLLSGLVSLGWLGEGLSLWPSFLGAGFGFSIFFAFSWAYERATGRVGLGGGDVKLLAMIGAYTGVMGVFCTIFVSSIFGSIVGVGWGVLSGQKNLRQIAIPYGPFLVIGALYYYFMGEALWFRLPSP